MKIKFTDLYKANKYSVNNIHKKINKGILRLIKKSSFVGGEEVVAFENSFAKFIMFMNRKVGS